MKHFKKVVAVLLLLFTSFLCWLDSCEPKKEPFKHSDFYIENVESNKKILENSKLYNSEYRQYLQNKIQEQEKEKEKEKQEQEQQQEQEKEEEKQERKSKKKGRGRKSSKKAKEDDGKIKEKTQRARLRKEQENNRLDKYIFKHKMKSKKATIKRDIKNISFFIVYF